MLKFLSIHFFERSIFTINSDFVILKYMFKRIVIIVLGIVSITVISKAWHVITGGFTTNKILPPKDCRSPVTELPTSLDLSHIFDREFKFLGKGCQVYAFESGDYVIKFLRHHKYKPPFWLNLISIGERLRRYRDGVVTYKKTRVKNAFRSYIMAYEDLKEETAVLYLHLGKTDHIKKNLTIIDKVGKRRLIDLDGSHFIIQKKAKKLRPYLLRVSKAGKLERSRELIDGYFDILKRRCLKGIKNVDHSGYLRNMGYIGDDIVEIDLGGYRKRDYVLTEKGMRKEFLYFAYKLERWAKKKSPNIAAYISYRKREVLKEALEELKRG